jgi:putative transcriptional regulator
MPKPLLLRALWLTAALVAGLLMWPAWGAGAVANGIFLIARPGMKDPNFSKTVVLVTLPKDGAPLGVIINRPLKQRLADLFPDFKTLKGKTDPIYFGGPVELPLVSFLVRSQKAPGDALPVLHDVYFSTDHDLFKKLMNRPNPTANVRVFAGYSGWAPGQLQTEIKRGGWYTLPADANTIFNDDPAKIWDELVERASREKTRWTQ